MAPRGFGRGVDRIVGHDRGGVVADVNKGIVLAVNGDRCKGILGKSSDVQGQARLKCPGLGSAW